LETFKNSVRFTVYAFVFIALGITFAGLSPKQQANTGATAPTAETILKSTTIKQQLKAELTTR
jgi:hypothetical protein